MIPEFTVTKTTELYLVKVLEYNIKNHLILVLDTRNCAANDS